MSLPKSVAKYISSEMLSGKYSPEVIESLEVALQCMESAYQISPEDYKSALDLETLYNNGIKTPKANLDPESKSLAEKFKAEGNELMAKEDIAGAIRAYSKAIENDPTNPVYYCNRAAAHSRANDSAQCIADCQSALDIDPNHAKAYGRMGVAYATIGNYPKAIEAYRKARAIDPSNESYSRNLSEAEKRLRGGNEGGATNTDQVQSNPAGATPNLGGFQMPNMGNFDFGQVMNIAQQAFQNPETMQLMERLFNTHVNPNGQSQNNSNGNNNPSST